MKQLADKSKLTKRLVRQAKLHSLNHSTRYKYGFDIPKNYQEAERLDRKNGNDDWRDANKLEHKQLREYDVFIDKGKSTGYRIPRGYQLIQGVCMFYNKNPVDWYCKQQSTSETVTYSAEFLSGRKCCENIIDHQAYLQYLETSVGDMVHMGRQ